VKKLGEDPPPIGIEKPEDVIRQESHPRGIETLPSKLERYATARVRSLEMVDYLRTLSDPTDSHLSRNVDQQRALDASIRLCSCGEWITLRHYYSVDQLRLIAANFCQQAKLCPLCAIRRGSRNMAVYLERFAFIQAQQPTLQPFLVTLTVKNGLDLVERVKHLKTAVRRCIDARRQALTGNKSGNTIFKDFSGGIGAFEITNNGNGWHPHVHFIILAETMPDQEKLSTEWLKRTKDSYIVDVRAIDPVNPASGFCEVFKYAMKFQGMSCENNWTAHCNLRGQHLLISFGNFYGVKLPDKLEDDCLDDLPYIDLFYRYLVGSSAYTLVKDELHNNPARCGLAVGPAGGGSGLPHQLLHAQDDLAQACTHVAPRIDKRTYREKKTVGRGDLALEAVRGSKF
jgi:hypothetical protein